jgi:hypothetical protein
VPVGIDIARILKWSLTLIQGAAYLFTVFTF